MSWSVLMAMIISFTSFSQDVISPSEVLTGTFLGETPPLRDLPVITEAEWQVMVEKSKKKILNPNIRYRDYPYTSQALPKGPDEAWQKGMGSQRETHAPLLSLDGQNAAGWPSDANGTIGPNHYMQTINLVYTIYNRAGAIVAGPTSLNTLFYGIAGSGSNDGDPIVLYDEQADRWLVAEFSISGSNDYMLIAVSTTNDPTGTWYKYSFDVADVPDYEKFGIWQDGYYMGTNTNGSSDIYIFNRSLMLAGQTPSGIAFDNPWRPGAANVFNCVPPVDNDGDFAPTGEPGIFIALNDDAVGGGTDQLWIIELDADWTTPANSTLTRTQQINVTSFDSNFGSDLSNIKQPGTTIELDAIPQLLMNPPQYRNFGSYETIVCCHTVDVDNTDHAGIRWYELRRASGSDWSIRQQGTYAPDSHSRWMGSIMLNGASEIALGYSISSSTVYPGIRYCGQSSSAYTAGNSTLDIAEEIIHTGAYSQTNYARWGDYASMQVDVADDETFWFTSQYSGGSNVVKTKIASFQIGTVILTANFAVNNPFPQTFSTVTFTDASFGSPSAWNWNISPSTFNYVGGTSSTSQNPRVQFTEPGNYTISLTITNGGNNDTETKNNFVTVTDCGYLYLPINVNFEGWSLPTCWTIKDNVGNNQVWHLSNPLNRTISTATAGNGFIMLDSDWYGSGNIQNTDLITPLLDLSSYTSVNLYFQHYYRNYTGNFARLYYSINNGATWTLLQQWISTTTNPAIYNVNVSTQVAGKSNVRFKWNYTGSYGYWWAVDDISITGTGPSTWTGATSTDWATASNWSTGTLPSSTSNVIIPATAANWPVISGDLNLGAACDTITLYGASQITVNGNIIIPSGKLISFYGTGTISLTGNWINTGGLLTQGDGTIKFTGSNVSKIIPSVTPVTNVMNYQRSTFPKGMTSLTTTFSTGPEGDDANMTVSLGFTFNYLGTDYTQAKLCTNGWLSFTSNNSVKTSDNLALFTTTTPNATLAPWFDNLSDDGTSVIRYKTEGTSPYRVFTAEWDSVLTYYTGAQERISFQLKLFETTNIIEFHYGDVIPGSNNAGEGASIGIEDATGGPNHYIEATTGLSNTQVLSLTSTNNWPSVNYRFSPTLGTLIFPNITVEKTGSYLDILGNTTIKGDLQVLSGTLSGPGAISGLLTVKGNITNNGFFTSGLGRVELSGTTSQLIQGSSPLICNKLKVFNPGGILLAIKTTVFDSLTLIGNIAVSDTLVLGSSATNPGNLLYTSGIISGNFKRWIAASTTNAVDFPVGTSATNHNARIIFSNNTGGAVVAKFTQGDPGSNTGFPLTENSLSFYESDLYMEGYWTLSAQNLTSSNYALELSGTGFNSLGPMDETARILKRSGPGSDWTLNGTHVNGSPPVAKRSSLSGFSQFILAKSCGSPAIVIPGGPDTVCINSIPEPIELSGAAVGGAATTAAWSITSLNPPNGGNNGTLSSTAQTSTPGTVIYTPPAGYAGTVTLTLTTNDPDGSCNAVSGNRTIVISSRYKISGTVKYHNAANTPLTSGIIIKLYKDGSQVGSDYIVINGTYEFPDLCPGAYELRVSSSMSTEGSINSTDAAQTNYWGVNPYEIEKVRFYAGDVTGSSYYINSTDALKIQSHFVNGTAFDKGSWTFWKTGETISSNTNPSESYASVTLSGANATADIYGLCSGDFNRSFIPGAQKNCLAIPELHTSETITAGANEMVTIPVKLNNSCSLSSVSLILNFPDSLVTIKSVNTDLEGGTLDWSAKDDEIRIGWMTMNPVQMKEEDVLMSISLLTEKDFLLGDTLRFTIAPDPLNELADASFQNIEGAALSIDEVASISLGTQNDSLNEMPILRAFPNPCNEFSIIDYSLDAKALVCLKVQNSSGTTVATLIDETQFPGTHSVKFDTGTLPAGIYTISLKVISEKEQYSGTLKLIINN